MPHHPAALAAAALALLPAAAVAAAPAVMPSACTRAITVASAEAGLPPGLLMAIGFTEAGRRVEGGATIWPWTVNVAGEGHYFASRSEAVDFVRRQQAQGRRSMDVGCMQINLRWHPEAFASLEEAFEPARNVAYAARFLRELQGGAAGSDAGAWSRAVGLYHSAVEEHAGPYRAQVGRYWQELADPVVTATLQRGGEAAPPARPPAASPNDPNDLFGLELVAYWATPFGAEIGPKDEVRPVLDTSVRPPFGDPAGPQIADAGPPARKRPTAPVTIKRFSPPPQIVVPPPRPARRKGLLLQQAAPR
jgi:hypothetical protein